MIPVKKFIFFCVSCLFLFNTAPAICAEHILLQIPESILTQATSAMLPFNIAAHSKAIEGDIKVINISNLQLGKNSISCRLHLAGSNLAILTKIAGHSIKLKVGAVEVDFTMQGAIRFDKKQQILYIKPVVDDLSATSPGGDGDIGQALVTLLNGKEFPITLQELEPIVAEAGAKTVTIQTRITNIMVKEDVMQLSLLPEISSK